MHKVITYVEYRAVSGVFQKFLEDTRHRIGLLQYNLSTGPCFMTLVSQALAFKVTMTIGPQ